MTDQPSLRDLLRRHDAARRSPEMSEEDRVRMRRAVVRAAAAPARAFGMPRWAVPAMAAVLLAGAALGLWARFTRAPLPSPREGAGVVEAKFVESAGTHSRRELHIVTPGGTQVVWVLDSDFRL
jgi:hypothetical protein